MTEQEDYPRFLTDERGFAILKVYEAEKKAGKVDPEMVEFCDAVNELPGMVTHYSCQGHQKDGRPNTGYVSLVMDRQRADAFREFGLVLRSCPGILCVDIFFDRAMAGDEEVYLERQRVMWYREEETPVWTYSSIRSVLKSVSECSPS